MQALAWNAAHGGAVFCSVCLGSVPDSSGSVVALSLEQIERGGPAIITNPEITQYFITIPEAT